LFDTLLIVISRVELLDIGLYMTEMNPSSSWLTEI